MSKKIVFFFQSFIIHNMLIKNVKITSIYLLILVILAILLYLTVTMWSSGLAFRLLIRGVEFK